MCSWSAFRYGRYETKKHQLESLSIVRNASFRFERARFHIQTGPTSLFERVKVVMSDVSNVRVDGKHFQVRVRERKIPQVVVDKIASFDVNEWDLITAEVRVDKGKFVASSWGCQHNGCYYVVVIGLGNLAETIYDVTDVNSKLLPKRLKYCIERHSEFYDFVEEVNRDLINDIPPRYNSFIDYRK